MIEQPWPKELEYVPPTMRFVDASTGRPKPIVGIHYPTADASRCALCKKPAAEIIADPKTPCEEAR